MIKNLYKKDEVLFWNVNEVQHQIVINDESFINDDGYILIMNEQRDKIRVLDECGKTMSELQTSDDRYLMYLQKHPRFGLSVVASIKNKDGKWSDKYLSWNENKFEIVSNSR